MPKNQGKPKTFEEAKKAVRREKKEAEAEERRMDAEAIVDNDSPDEDIFSSEDAFYNSQFSNHNIDYNDEPSFDDVKVRTRVQSLTFPGDEPIMEKIMNDPNCTIINKVITPMPKEGVIMAYIEWEEIEGI